MSAVRTMERADPFGSDFDLLLAAAQSGAAWALRRLYEALAPAVYGYARGQGATDPEGLVNDTFSRAFRRLDSFSGDSAALRSWIFTIAHNVLIDERRRAARRPVEAGPVEDHDATETVESAEAAALRTIEEQRVRWLLGQLAPDQREVLTLRLLGDMTIAQVAEVLGRSVGATKALQRRGLNRLRSILEQGVPL